jgi:hypothetical protein
MSKEVWFRSASKRICLCTFVVSVALSSIALAEQSTGKAAIREHLQAEFTLTKTTASQDEIVTPGCVVVLRKDNLVAMPLSNKNFYQNIYRNGHIDQGALGKFAKISNGLGNTTIGGTTRTFVSGEKLWITNITVREKDVLFDLYSDPYNEVRYRANLSFPFSKGESPSVEEVDRNIAEVFTVQPLDANAQQAQASPAPQAGASPQTQQLRPVSSQPVQEAPPTPIAPPPPPADAPQPTPKTVSLGQSKDEVVSILGKPDKIVNLGTKQLYVYKDIKLTFVSGKVTNVE